MRVGFIGLGKLGFPVAMAMASRGIEVYGYDLREPNVEQTIAHEEGFAEVYEQGKPLFHFVPLAQVVANCDVCFLAVQTPHEPRFEGVTPLPEERADFDYSHLIEAAKQFTHECEAQGKHRTLAVISTVLPGTMRDKVIPGMGTPNVDLVYNPSFIAMGTVIKDFTDPEFVLLGGDSGEVESVYAQLWGIDKPRHIRTSVPNAELIKVAYNTFIGLKLAFANTLQEVCHKTEGTDVDEVTGALKLAHRRLISPAYLDAGMGDGGGCHPRDNIALSWLARELDLSYDLFEAAMLQRERHAEWLAELMCEAADEHGLPLGILGTAYKPGSHIQTGSPALLVASVLCERGYDPQLNDPHVQVERPWIVLGEPKVWLVGCKHPEFPIDLPKGSVVIDPWRFWPDQEGVTLVRLGEAAGGRHRLHPSERDPEALRQRAA